MTIIRIVAVMVFVYQFAASAVLAEPQFPLIEERTEAAIRQLTASVPGAIAAAHTRDPCQEFNNQRWVALLLRDIALLMQHSQNSEQHSALVSAGRAAEADLLSRSPKQYLQSSYVRCYGDGSGSEPQTLQMVMTALAAWDGVATAPGVRGFMQTARRELVRFGWIKHYRAYALTDTSIPNAFAQAVTVLRLLAAYGEGNLRYGFLVPGLDSLFAAQATRPKQARCRGRPQLYGGWYHVRGRDCAQQLGYMGLIVDSLVGLDQYLRSTGACNERRWAPICRKIPQSLAAVLVWLKNDQKDGFYLSPAPGTSASAPSSESHTEGVRIAFKTLKTLLEHGYSIDTRIRSGFNRETITFGDLETSAIQGANVTGYDNSVSAILEYQAEKDAQRTRSAGRASDGSG
jgi:hypothetical protein